MSVRPYSPIASLMAVARQMVRPDIFGDYLYRDGRPSQLKCYLSQTNGSLVRGLCKMWITWSAPLEHAIYQSTFSQTHTHEHVNTHRNIHTHTHTFMHDHTHSSHRQGGGGCCRGCLSTNNNSILNGKQNMLPGEYSGQGQPTESLTALWLTLSPSYRYTSIVTWFPLPDTFSEALLR